MNSPTNQESSNMKKEMLVTLIRARFDEIRRMQDEIRKLSFELGYAGEQFDAILAEAKKELSKEDLTMIWELGKKDDNCPFKKLSDLKVMHKKKEKYFLSEDYLYEAIGKEDARTVLALMKSIYESAGKGHNF